MNNKIAPHNAEQFCLRYPPHTYGIVTNEPDDVALFTAASADSTMKLYVVEATRPERFSECAVTNAPSETTSVLVAFGSTGETVEA